MSSVSVFLVGIALTIVFALIAIRYLQSHLKGILVDLCGTSERAAFWTAFSNLTLLCAPLLFALHFRPDNGPPSVLIFGLGDQIERSVLGFLIAVVILGFVLGRFIPREKTPARVPSAEPNK